jgi:hypothetical protein
MGTSITISPSGSRDLLVRGPRGRGRDPLMRSSGGRWARAGKWRAFRASSTRWGERLSPAAGRVSPFSGSAVVIELRALIGRSTSPLAVILR